MIDSSELVYTLKYSNVYLLKKLISISNNYILNVLNTIVNEFMFICSFRNGNSLDRTEITHEYWLKDSCYNNSRW